MNRHRLAAAAALGLCISCLAAAGTTHPDPVPLDRLNYTKSLLPGSDYDSEIPSPGDLLGFPLGSRMATPEDIGRCLAAWEEASSRATVHEYARTWEGRPLRYVVVTSPENHDRLAWIRAGYDALADPEDLTEEEGRNLVETLPAVAWMAYSIHGDETSGADASLALLYHLIASKDEETRRLLDGVVVIVDPMMNPDGRARWARQVAEHRGAMPNVDDQSLLHAGYWPWGRMNHYLFDLNRDWILGVHPETRGRIRAAGSWHPLLFVDGHEMGSQGTYLFSPQRAPVNPHIPGYQAAWHGRFAADQAAAFDRAGWTYYTGEWNEGWYPGYSDSWASFRGAMGILYEQASITEDAVRRPHGALQPYMESVHHQLTSSLANLRTLRAGSRELLGDFLAYRRAAVSAEGPYAGRVFAILPTENRSRLHRFLDLMHLQGIRVYESAAAFTAERAVDQAGRELKRVEVPPGAVLVPNRQPEAHLVAAMLEFETRMTPEYLERERKEILRRGRSTVYDVTAWSLTMMYGLQALTLEGGMPASARPIDPDGSGPEAAPPAVAGAAIWVFDGEDDRSPSVAARLMEAGLEVRVADREFEFEGSRHPRGSVVILASDSLALGTPRERVEEAIRAATSGSGLAATAHRAGLGEGDLPDIGGRHFRLLEPPQVAVLARGEINGYDFGAIWHMLDRRIGLRHSHLDEGTLGSADLRRYNVLIIPDRRGGEMEESLLSKLRAWVESGGTLVAVGRSTAPFIAAGSEMSKVRDLPDALEDLDRYEQRIRREWMASITASPSADEIWSHTALTAGGKDWVMGEPAPRPAAERLKAGDEWRKLFMPQGVILAARVDPEHWLTFGARSEVPILTADYPVLMAAGQIEAPVRFGALEEDGARAGAVRSGAGEKGAEGRIGWAALPEGWRMRLRMSGLLWPEAGERLANSAWVTRESRGRGQVILFASPPDFRGSTPATARFLANAIVYGPGLGANHPIRP